MIYIVTIRQGYSKIKFCFNNYQEMIDFMRSAYSSHIEDSEDKEFSVTMEIEDEKNRANINTIANEVRFNGVL